MAHFLKDPADRDSFEVPWDDRLAVGETISTVTWTITPPGSLAQPVSPTTPPTTTVATIWLESGTVGQSYTIACKVTTNQSRILERSFTVQVEDR